jgi:salicylate hydroxylase
MADHSPAPVLIVGGGIGGLALSLALARAGVASHVLERRAAWSEAGAGIQLSPNATRVLAALGVDERLTPLAGLPEAIVVRDARSARTLQRLPLGDWIRTRHGAPYWQVHRRDLQAALVAAVEAQPGITVTLGAEVIGIEETEAAVCARIASGAVVTGRVLVGADGVHSFVRATHLGLGEPRFTGRTAARAVLAAGANSRLLTPTETGVWLAPGAHIVHYPVRGGREIALVVVRSETWCDEDWSAPVAEGQIEAVLRTTAPALAEEIGTGHGWRRWALLEMPALPRWSTGRVTLLGDAAHPTFPFLAQGGALALEDAWVLGRLLGETRTSGDAAGALAAYERARRERTSRVVAAARRNGVVFHLAGLAATARNLAMRAIPGERVMTGYDWVYGWRPE